jgi:hypothetical protein
VSQVSIRAVALWSAIAMIQRQSSVGAINACNAKWGGSGSVSTSFHSRDLIRPVAGCGYQFTSAIRELSASPNERAAAGMAAAQLKSALPPTNLPESVSELIGRGDDLGNVVSLTAPCVAGRALAALRFQPGSSHGGNAAANVRSQGTITRNSAL